MYKAMIKAAEGLSKVAFPITRPVRAEADLVGAKLPVGRRNPPGRVRTMGRMAGGGLKGALWGAGLNMARAAVSNALGGDESIGKAALTGSLAGGAIGALGNTEFARTKIRPALRLGVAKLRGVDYQRGNQAYLADKAARTAASDAAFNNAFKVTGTKTVTPVFDPGEFRGSTNDMWGGPARQGRRFSVPETPAPAPAAVPPAPAPAATPAPAPAATPAPAPAAAPATNTRMGDAYVAATTDFDRQKANRIQASLAKQLRRQRAELGGKESDDEINNIARDLARQRVMANKGQTKVAMLAKKRTLLSRIFSR